MDGAPAFRSAPDEDARRVASLHQGMREADAGDPGAAEYRFRDVLTASRGSGTRAERLALSCLVTLFARRRRDVEALILSRRHATLARQAGTAEDVCFAMVGLADSFVRIEDWERFDGASREFETSIAAYGGQHATALRRHLFRMRAERELVRGDVAAAQRELVRIADLPVAAGDDAADVGCLVLEAAVQLRLGRPELARAALARAPDEPDSANAAALEAHHLAAICALEIDGIPAAAEAIRRALALIEGPAAGRHPPATRKQLARRLGDLAATRCGDVDLAKRCYDVAAAALLQRAAEIEGAMRGIPELATPSEDDALALAAFRTRFAATRTRLLQSVAALLRVRILAGDGPSWTAVNEGGVIGVCAWCMRVRLADGTMLPVGHFLPRDSNLVVSHGICGPCAIRMTASFRQPAGVGEMP